MQIFKDNDIDISIIKNKKVGVIGFGNQGKAQVKNLIDSGVDVIVGIREKSKSIDILKKKAIPYVEVDTLVNEVDIISLLVPDSEMKNIYYNFRR